jgi:hypothetical protein
LKRLTEKSVGETAIAAVRKLNGPFFAPEL